MVWATPRNDLLAGSACCLLAIRTNTSDHTVTAYTIRESCDTYDDTYYCKE